MGCPSTAIAVEELARVGVTSFIRVGSTGALQPASSPATSIVSEGSFRNDGTTDTYAPKGYPAVPDLELTLALERAARAHGPEHGLAVHAGLNVTDDAFYAESPAWTEQMSGLGLLNVEMESSAMFVVARQRGLRAGMICAVSSNLVGGTSVYDDEAHKRLADGLGRQHRGGARRGGRARPLSSRVGLNLHTHLEGWVRPETAADLARRWASRIRRAAGTRPCG